MNYKKIIFTISFLVIFGFLFNAGAPTANAMTMAEIQAQIATLQAQIAQLQQQLIQLQGTPATWCYDFNRNLKYGNAGSEVSALQTALQKEGFYKRTINGDFDEYTASAVVGFQEKYAAEILSPWGLEHGTGYVGKTTREKLNKLYGCGVVPPPVKPYIKVISPNGGERWEAGKTYNITWTANGVNKTMIEVIKGNQGWHLAYNLPASQNKFSWTIPSVVGLGNDYKIHVWDQTNGTPEDYSDNYFSITAATTTPSITVLSPNGGEKWTVGNTYQIFWESTGIVQTDKIRVSVVDYTFSYPTEYDLVYNLTGNLGAYSWAIPTNFNTSFKYKIKVEGCKTTNGITNCYSDLSDNYFSIVSAVTPSITINSNPQADSNGNVTIKQGTQITITGVPSNLSGQMGVDYTRAFFFDPIFNNACSNTDWVMTCIANQIGTSNFYIRLYKGGQTYQSNIIKVTVIAPTPSITIISPNGGERWVVGNKYDITWASKGVDKTMIEVIKGNQGWHLAYNLPASQNKFSWTIPSVVGLGNDYKIHVWDQTNGTPEDYSDNYFSIIK